MRRTIAALLLVILLPALVVVNASTWALRTVLDDAAFAATVGRVMDTPDVKEAIATRIEPPATPPDFSTLSDGSQRWKNLEEIQ